MLKKSFPFYKQPDSKDCGPTCLKIIAKYYGKTLSIQKLRELSETTREGSNLLTLSEAAEKIGFRTLGVKLSVKNTVLLITIKNYKKPKSLGTTTKSLGKLLNLLRYIG